MNCSLSAQPPQNESVLKQQAYTEDLRLFSLSLPAVLLVGVIVVVPMAWLFWMSFFGSGSFSLINYERILQPSYSLTLLTTFKLAFIVTGICVLLGYPLSYVAAQLPSRWGRVIILCVLFPLWTSLLVRMYAWLVLLQKNGQINSWLQQLGVIDTPLQLMYNFTGAVIGMVHIMLPFMVLPLYASMRTIDETYMRAAANLGASPVKAFWQIYAPLSLSGLRAGAISVFIFSLGFYVTPAMLGGGRVMTWAMLLQSSLSMYADWGATSALGVVFLIITLPVLWLFLRLTGSSNRSGGVR